MSTIIFCKPLETYLHDTCIHNQGPISSHSKLKATAKIGPAAKPLVRDQHKGKAPMDPTTQTNTPSIPKLMADSFAASQIEAQRGTTTRTPAEAEVTAKKREEPSTAPALSTDLSDWDIPLSQMIGQTTSNPSGQLYQLGMIWKARNDCLFNDKIVDGPELAEMVKVRVALWCKQSYRGLQYSVEDIVNNLDRIKV
ncbi:hypothetical protein HYC85_030048 [Camellia sinensis]|uniref:Uncharacterized protein n=1 Tax=Camellia sinensis TaxID=4442 RepID=A0A7J7G0A2_CAMSI|nr:hypothetical protein HYC85_030048 [Camellia sinensis]